MYNKALASLGLIILGAMGMTTSVQAVVITPSTPGIIPGPTFGPSNCEPACINTVFGTSLTRDDLLYKAEQRDGMAPSEEGQFTSSYSTVFLATADDPSGATITYGSGPSIDCPGCYLAIKDGAIAPRYYFFDLLAWNGTETLSLSGFWPGPGAISHISIWGRPVAVYEPGTLALMSAGLLGFALLSRRRRAKA